MTDSNSVNLFRELHRRGEPLVLYNIWDAGSARAVVDAGARAVATGSASVSSAQGFPDGEALPLDDLERTARRIVRAVDVPVSVDIESGYGPAPAEVAATALRIARAGAVGCNFEDQDIRGGAIFATDLQCRRLSAIREGLAREGLDMFVNARTDLFLQAPADQHVSLVSSAIARAKAYRDAGADGFFAPGLIDQASIRVLCEHIDLPLNIMFRNRAPSVRELGRLGVSRVSFGIGPYRRAMEELKIAARSIY